MKNGSYQPHIIWKKEIWPKLPLFVTSSFDATGRHSLSLVVPLVVICCHSLSFVVIRCTKCCHSLSLIPIRCHSFPFVATRCTTRCHSLSLDIPLVCLFINDRFKELETFGIQILFFKNLYHLNKKFKENFLNIEVYGVFLLTFILRVF